MNDVHARVEFDPKGDGPADWYVEIHDDGGRLIHRNFMSIENAGLFIGALVPICRNGDEPSGELIHALTINR